ncbi:MAG: DUF4065 domain-containing protein [Bacteroidia bacterium]|nr:DUF4065 domain-containing protein [Bacteroidia bacterium]
MNQSLTPQQIGQRIAQLRKQRGLSQEELARQIPMSRPSLAQVERGNRNLSVGELQQISLILRFSLDEFLSENFKAGQENLIQEPATLYEVKERISTPQLNPLKFKNVILYLLTHCAGRPNVGETVIARLLYFCDFNYYEIYEEQLTGATYRKLPYGPAPEPLDRILDQMIEARLLQKIKTEYRGHPQTRYIPLKSADLTTLKASETAVIDKVIAQMGDWQESELTRYALGDKPWRASGENEVIDYELVFYRRPPYPMRTYSEENEQNII